MEYMVPHITLCVNGHNICDICRPKLDDCPTCRKQFLSTRNVGLEKMAREVYYPVLTGSFDVKKCSPMISLMNTKSFVSTVI
jgi:hypothetical protein